MTTYDGDRVADRVGLWVDEPRDFVRLLQDQPARRVLTCADRPGGMLRPVKIGISTPAVLAVPGVASAWEREAEVGEIRAAWGRPEHDGFTIDPLPVQPTVPIWVGGRTARSLRRAVTLGTGWMPFGLTRTEIAGLLDGVDLPEDFEVVLATGRAVDPLGDRDRTLRTIDGLAGAGATAITASVAATSARHYGEQLGALIEIAGEAAEVGDR